METYHKDMGSFQRPPTSLIWDNLSIKKKSNGPMHYNTLNFFLKSVTL